MNMNTFCVTGNCYLPQPPRAWSRVQNSCSLIAPTDDNEFVQVPYTTQVVPYGELGSKLAMINKGNVLQYKKNSSNLTQWQKYSLIAKGKWVNRTTTWASQSTRGYTNPNTQSLLRVGGTNVTLDGVPTDLPVTCPRLPIINNNVLPSNGGGGISNPPIPPPPPPPTPGGSTVIPIIPIAIILPIVIQDFGNLVCGTKENLCTGEIFEPIKLDNCHPTTDSDVPGAIQDLCWNDGNPTWYPRQRYVMSNSANKWPVNAVLGSAVKPSTPILSVVITNCRVATLSWNFDFECLPITSYNIYQNGELFATISGSANSYSVSLDAGTYSFSIIGVNNGISSDISNVVTVTINTFIPPIFTGTIFYTLIITGTVYTYQFTSGTGSITFNSEITNAQLLVVGPGGNGGIGQDNVSNEGTGGGGGGGGEINYITGLTFLTNQTCNIVVGSNPANSEFDTYNASTGGIGGNGTVGGGPGGIAGTNGGNGGNGSNNQGSNGQPGSNGTQYSIGSIINTYYSGGGGGGSNGPEPPGGGGLSGGGTGGDFSNPPFPGTVNTGGGGGGSSASQGEPVPGGVGGTGIVILSFNICPLLN